LIESFNIPILLLTFNRPETTQQVFDQIKQKKPKFLYVAADGPRKHVAGDFEKCQQVRNIIKQVNWDCEVKTLFQEDNLSCGNAVNTAISWFFKNESEGIILEDDCLPDLSFFTYCEELLVKYRNVDEVKLISGTNLYINGRDNSYYFTKYANIWGWASWRRVWEEYDFEMKNFNENEFDKKLGHIFQSNAEKMYWKKIFFRTQKLQINTWDYQLLYSIWENNGIAINPNINLIKNIGFKTNSTREFLSDSKKMADSSSISFPLVHPKMELDSKANRYIFKNIYSYSVNRMFRLLRENKFTVLLKYIFNHFLKKQNR
jgi:hypothetical protein